MRVLITNDDGIQASGLQALREALTEIDGLEVFVIAPDSNRSATARSITTRSPLWVQEIPFKDGSSGFATDGTPVDCARFAELGLIGERPELIVSGINHGSNLGDDITYSGTVAAALEGIVLGIPAIALSQQSEASGADYYAKREYDFAASAAFSAELVRRVAEDPLPADPWGAERRRGYSPRQAPLQRRDASDRHRRRDRSEPVPDLRLRAFVRGRGGLRPLCDREGSHLRHPRPLRSHRPA
jgi:5'/3'-nucleotidase SurE